jgi:alkanesulfonate monooxygenase SsuD/methylene tetrahydromethanopterin reductase-like flavin-dependent oxidoreductase (luciferase family)
LKVSLFYLPSVGTRAEIEAGGAGRRGELYDRMLEDLSAQAKAADELGYDSISFTEHHFHIEGFELSNNPVLLDLFVAMQTKRLRVGQLGIVLPAENPIRVAENIAMLDRMSGGRANAGFARGYQRRWVDTLAQQVHGIHGALPHQHDEIDAANREAFEECFRIVKAAWTEDFLSYDGRYWKVPVEGTPWDLEATRRYGGGVVGGTVRSVAVVPKPVQKPHPPIFQPFASSERSIRWCAEESVTAILPPLHPLTERRLVDLYAEVSGRPPGEGIGVLRDVVIADTDEEAWSIWADGPLFCGQNWFSPFGFDRGLAHPETGEAPSLSDSGLALVGSVDTVCRQLEALRERLPVAWLFGWMYIGLTPHHRIMRTL